MAVLQTLAKKFLVRIFAKTILARLFTRLFKCLRLEGYQRPNTADAYQMPSKRRCLPKANAILDTFVPVC